ncbi:hypothetical protein CC1G_05160 [Coprinopsis cinerea okayama7|uniref:Hydrophobin n=1 Tax=Coprinopsis cinerea (strain Okayama-7 / 130 / ATCC MYA-4618 / FGSC 9003) TaxID=240176 RepID=A8NG28_COPC7|nr:hypothetical protein CC1G_05160 [Coprinopsis cinerea okayama7\|eukprot:XP_001833460.2 hypothetical protein CC1G_05160 [Coprinopsis cinerea okayama7\
MKPFAFFVALFVLSSSLFMHVTAIPRVHRGPNAARLARGLGPLPPTRRSPTLELHVHPAFPNNAQPESASNVVGEEMTTAGNPSLALILRLYNLNLPPQTPVGKECTAGSNQGQCTGGAQLKLCCDDIAGLPVNGRVAVSCTAFPS